MMIYDCQLLFRGQDNSATLTHLVAVPCEKINAQRKKAALSDDTKTICVSVSFKQEHAGDDNIVPYTSYLLETKCI